MLNCELVTWCSTSTQVQSTSSIVCPWRSNVWHIVTYCLFYKTLILFTTNSNSFVHVRGSLVCFATNYAHFSLTELLTILFCYTLLQV